MSPDITTVLLYNNGRGCFKLLSTQSSNAVFSLTPAGSIERKRITIPEPKAGCLRAIRDNEIDPLCCWSTPRRIKILY